MKHERFDDNKYYDQWWGGTIYIFKHKEILQKYTYDEYGKTYLERLNGNKLKANQEPKLKEEEFIKLKESLIEYIKNHSKEDLGKTKKIGKIIERLLLHEKFNDQDEDYINYPE